MDREVGAIIGGGEKIAYQLDHLAALSATCDLPLLVTDEDLAEHLLKFYPGSKPRFVSFFDMQLSELKKCYRSLFLSRFLEPEEKEQFQEIEPYDCKLVMSSHGYSDKGVEHFGYFEQFAEQDVLLVYGQRMWNIIHEKKVKRPFDAVLTGNYRLNYYRKNKEVIDAVFEKHYPKFDSKKIKILFAPTWNQFTDEKELRFFIDVLLNKKPSDVQLVVKLHPFFKGHFPGAYALIQEHFSTCQDIVFVDDLTSIMPLLEKIDVYLGNLSSMGYDFLAFDKPLFFLTQQQESYLWDPRHYLHQCGHSITPSERENIYPFLLKQLPTDQKLYASIRKKVFEETFDVHVDIDSLKWLIQEAIA